MARGARLVLLAAGLLLLAVVCASFSGNAIARRFVGAELRRLAGPEARIERLALGFFGQRLRMEGLLIPSPPGFHNVPLARIPLLDARIAPLALLSRHVELPEVALAVDEINLVRNAAGSWNIDGFLSSRPASASSRSGGKTPLAPAQGWRTHIGRLTLSLDRIRILEERADGSVGERSLALHLDHEVFENLDGPGEVAQVVALRVIRSTGIRALSSAGDRIAAGLQHVGGAGMESMRGLGEDLLGRAKRAVDWFQKR